MRSLTKFVVRPGRCARTSRRPGENDAMRQPLWANWTMRKPKRQRPRRGSTSL